MTGWHCFLRNTRCAGGMPGTTLPSLSYWVRNYGVVARWTRSGRFTPKPSTSARHCFGQQGRMALRDWHFAWWVSSGITGNSPETSPSSSELPLSLWGQRRMRHRS